MPQLDPGLECLAAALTPSEDAVRVARMARFGVRSGSLKRSLAGVIPLNEAV
jgi:hypothetical protein